MRAIITILLFLSFGAVGQTVYCPIPAGLTTSAVVVYATYNPLASAKGSNIGLSGGNLTETPAGRGQVRATKAITSKVFWEVLPSISGTGIMIGISTAASDVEKYTGQEASSYGWNNPGGVYNALSIIGMNANTYTTGDAILVAVDPSGNTLKYYKGSTLQGTITITGGVTYYPTDGSPSAGSGSSTTANYGQNPYSASTATARAALIAAGYTGI